MTIVDISLLVSCSVCNWYSYLLMFGYRIIDLGVMTPCEKIIDTAIRENVGK